MIFHLQWLLPLTLPSPRAGASKAGATARGEDKGEGTCAFYATLGLTQVSIDSAVLPDDSIRRRGRERGRLASRGRVGRLPRRFARRFEIGQAHFGVFAGEDQAVRARFEGGGHGGVGVFR